MDQKEINKMVKELEKAGYKIKRDVPTVKKTFEVEEATVNEFMTMVDKRGLKVKEAIDEALRDWIKKKVQLDVQENLNCLGVSLSERMWEE